MLDTLEENALAVLKHGPRRPTFKEFCLRLQVELGLGLDESGYFKASEIIDRLKFKGIVRELDQHFIVVNSQSSVGQEISGGE